MLATTVAMATPLEPYEQTGENCRALDYERDDAPVRNDPLCRSKVQPALRAFNDVEKYPSEQ